MSEIKETYLFRPVRSDDALALLSLIEQSAGGLSSLQPRLGFLEEYIETSISSFSGEKDLESAHKYLLGMFEVRSNRLIGCAAVKTQIGIELSLIHI